MVFRSDATNLVANDTNGSGDVFVRDLAAGTTTLGVNGAGSVSGNSQSGFLGNLGISADGRYVVFGSFASNLGANRDAHTSADRHADAQRD